MLERVSTTNLLEVYRAIIDEVFVDLSVINNLLKWYEVPLSFKTAEFNSSDH